MRCANLVRSVSCPSILARTSTWAWRTPCFKWTTQNLFAWYLLWLLPLIALLVEPGQFLGVKFSAMSAWLIFSGLIGLSYLFFVQWKPYPWVQMLEFIPLYLMLIVAALLRWQRR